MEMVKNIRLILFAVPLFFLSVTASQAVVSLANTESTGVRINIDNNITSGLIATGSGVPGDFEVIMCGTFSDGNNAFLDPVPDSWTTIDSGECGGSGQCILGIFGRFAESAGTSDISCNWTDPTDAFTAGAFRYHGVDPDNPVVDVACNTGGPQSIIIAPSVNTEPGSAVIVVIQAGRLALDMMDVSNLAEPVFQGDFLAIGGTQFGEQEEMLGISILFPAGGPTGDIPLLPADDIDWRACTIALRMEPTEIPTLSEWGMIASATGLMLIGVYFALKRKKRQVI
jgi:hypothetical protein